MILEITEPGAYLSRNHDQFIIKLNDQKREIPAVKVDGITISCNALITTSAIQLCLERKIQLVLCNYTGRPYCRLWYPSSGKNTELRRRQYLAIRNSIGIQIIQHILKIKFEEQRKLLIDLSNNRKFKTSETIQALKILNDSIKSLNTLPMNNVKQTLLGIEGNCSNNYFQAINSILPSKWKFSKRSQHPANDPFNALLNYAYGMAYQEVEKIIILSGLDENAGLYHADQYGKPTLSFDLIEISRPKIDRLVITLISKRKAKDNWFEYNEGEVSLSKIGRIQLIKAFHDKVRLSLQKETWTLTRWVIDKLMGGE